MQVISKRLQAMIAEQLNMKHREIDPEQDLFTHYHADSIDKIELILKIEKAFAVKFNDSDLNEFTSLNSIAKLIEKLINKAYQAPH